MVVTNAKQLALRWATLHLDFGYGAALRLAGGILTPRQSREGWQEDGGRKTDNKSRPRVSERLANVLCVGRAGRLIFNHGVR